MHTLKATAIAAIAAGIFIAAESAHAITASDYGERTSEERVAYKVGTVDMAAELFRLMGDDSRADCVIRWAESTESVKEVHYAMEKNPTAPAAAVMEALMKLRCGDYK